MEKGAEEGNLDKRVVSLDALYSESAQMFRHYSNCSLTIRLSVIVQGLAIAYASGSLFQENNFSFALVASLFGLWFTIVLFGVYWAYDQAINDFYVTLVRLEGKASADEAETFRPFTHFETIRKKRYKKFAVRLVTLYGAFLSIGLAFVIIAVLSVLHL